VSGPAAIVHNAADLPQGRQRAIAIGNFDGVHRGHQRLIAEMVAAARRDGLEATVLTFSPHPALVLAPDRAPPLLMPEARRHQLLLALGVEHIVVQRFDRDFAAQAPRAFVEELLLATLSARVVCVGYDFTFGAKRAGTTAMLTSLGLELGFGAIVTDAVRVGGVVCASSAVRGLLASGRIADASALLGRLPELEGDVIHGAGRGRTIGVPTANLALAGEVRPALGVYAAWAELADGSRHRAAVNIGTNPTFTNDSDRVHIEAHLLDFDRDLYGQRLRLHLITRLRAEQRFASKDELIAQIRADVEAARIAEPAALPPID
jgi:riboflavin kinase / FMN adenylyltransferase